MKKKSLIILSFVLFLFFHCDYEKLTGYNYDAEIPNDIIQFSGTIRNTFTNIPVQNAKITIGVYSTISDISGNYVLYYRKGIDEDRNMPVPLEVRASKYQTYSIQILIGESDEERNFSLTYIAPIIEDFYIGLEQQEVPACYVRIRDYQGTNDISTVTGDFIITVLDMIPIDPYLYYTRSFSFANNISLYEAIYKCLLPRQWLDQDNRVIITAFDQSGNSDTLSVKIQ